MKHLSISFLLLLATLFGCQDHTTPAGQLTEFTFETGDPNNEGKQYFEYNAKGYLTEITDVDDTNASSTQTFTLTDCN